MNKSKIRAIRVGVSAGLLACTGAQLGGPAQAAPQYSFAYGAGTESRTWIASKSTQDGGPCTIVLDDAAANSAPQANQIDGVVIHRSALPINGQNQITINWGANVASTAKELLVRQVKLPGCALTATIEHWGPGQRTFSVPAATAMLVVSATEGTVQPWFTVS
jgi:hypothetical protein